MAPSETSREQTPGPDVESIDDESNRKLAALATEHGGFLRGLARKLCRDHFDPEDLYQDVLLKMAVHLSQLPPDANHVAWMARVMRNLFIDRVRARKAARPEVSLDDVTVAAPAAETRHWWEQVSADEIRAATAELPDELRGAFERFAFERQSYKEIARALGIPVATVGTRVLRARRRLRGMLGGDHE